MRHVERGADLLQVAFCLFRSLTAPLRGRRDAKRPQQLSRGRARITRLAEDRMQSLAHQMVKDEIDDAPGIKGLYVGRRSVDVHDPDTTSTGPRWQSQLETVPGNKRFTL